MRFYVIITVLYFLFFGCSQSEKEIEVHLDAISQYIIIPLDSEWEREVSMNYEEPRFLLHTCYSDTIFEINYFYSKNRKERVYIDSYSKMFRNDDYFYRIEFNYSDTLFCYKSNDSLFTNKIFIQGKYLYQANNNELTKEQFDYFYANFDSLKKLKGDTLPELIPNARSLQE